MLEEAAGTSPARSQSDFVLIKRRVHGKSTYDFKQVDPIIIIVSNK